MDKLTELIELLQEVKEHGIDLDNFISDIETNFNIVDNSL